MPEINYERQEGFAQNPPIAHALKIDDTPFVNIALSPGGEVYAPAQ